MARYDFGVFKVKGTNRVFKIDYSEQTLTVGDKVIEFNSTVHGPMAQEEGDVFLKGADWYLGWELDEGRNRHLQFTEKGKSMDLELMSGGWPEDFI